MTSTINRITFAFIFYIININFVATLNRLWIIYNFPRANFVTRIFLRTIFYSTYLVFENIFGRQSIRQSVARHSSHGSNSDIIALQAIFRPRLGYDYIYWAGVNHLVRSTKLLLYPWNEGDSSKTRALLCSYWLQRRSGNIVGVGVCCANKSHGQCHAFVFRSYND